MKEIIMNRLIIGLVTYVFVMVFLYAWCAFVSVEFNPLQWSREGREYFAVFGSLGSLCVATFAATFP